MYFEKKRAFATGIAVCGSGLGTFVMAPVSQGYEIPNYLLEGVEVPTPISRHVCTYKYISKLIMFVQVIQE